MHIEFRYLIADLLAKFGEGNGELLPSAIFLELKEKALKVDDCPRQIGADLMTDFCFQWSKLLQSSVLGNTRPEDLAVKLVKFLDGADVYRAKDFTLRVEGLGFLNAVTKDSLLVDLLSRSRQSAGCSFFSTAPFAAERISPPADLGIENLKKGFDPADYSRERFVTSHNEQVRELLRALPVDFSPEDLLQLMAVKTDPELDFNVYLKGIGGSENVPWLLRKFYQDSKSFRCQIAERFSLEKWTGKIAGDAIEKNASSLILRFRYIAQQAYTTHRPELLVAHCVAVAKAFYEIYHHPRGRSFCARTMNYQLLYDIVETLALLVRESLLILGLPKILTEDNAK